jgi:hypothetical protein
MCRSYESLFHAYGRVFFAANEVCIAAIKNKYECTPQQ